MNVGERIKSLRKQFNLSQTELAQGVCTQAFISKVEKGNIAPSADLLWKLAKRLGVTLDYLISSSDDDRYDYSEEVLQQLKKTAVNRDYETIRSIVKAEEKNPYFKSRHLRILLWYKAIPAYFIDKDFDTAMSYLDEALTLSETTAQAHDEISIQILMAKANLYSQSGQYEASFNIYERALKQYAIIPDIRDIHLKIKLFYNYAVALRNSGQPVQSNRLLEKAIQNSKEQQSMYILGDIYYYAGKNYHDLKQLELSRKSFTKALYAYDLADNQKMYTVTQGLLDRIPSGNP